MDDPTATPGVVADDPELETPADEAEPLEGEDAADDADQPAAPSPIAQAEYTRATQLAASIRRELGLPKGATQAEVTAAIQSIRAQPDDEDGDDYEEAPELLAERERRIASEVRFASAIYGEQPTADALELLSAARSTDDVEELLTMVFAFRDNHPAALAAPAPKAAAAAADAAEDDGGTEGDIDLSEGDVASRQRESTPAGRRESGAVNAIRGLFEQAGIASRPPR
jgi:hypothetical protein